MKKVIFFIVMFILILIPSVYAESVRGYVAFFDDNKNLMIVETSLGYSVMEIYSYGAVFEGDNVVGELHSYGFKSIYDITTDVSINVYIDDYMLSRDDAMRWLYNH